MRPVFLFVAFLAVLLIAVVAIAQCPNCPNGTCPATVCQPAIPPAAPVTACGPAATGEVSVPVTAIVVPRRRLLAPGPFHGGPAPFHGGPEPFHGGYGYGGGYHVPWGVPYVAPFVAPIINYATAPRMVTNPLTGQTEMMNPGQWVAAAPGSAVPYVWQSLPIWPLGAVATETTTANLGADTAVGVASFFKTHKPVRHAIAAVLEKKPLRHLLARIFHRRK
jgi:hypothetical protein